MKMTMHIDEELLERVMEAHGFASKTEAVDHALRELDRRHRFRKLVAKPSPFTPEELSAGVEPGYDILSLRAAEAPATYRHARKRRR